MRKCVVMSVVTYFEHHVCLLAKLLMSVHNSIMFYPQSCKNVDHENENENDLNHERAPLESNL